MYGLLTFYIIILMNIDYNIIMIIDHLIYNYRESILQAHAVDASWLTLP